MTPVVKLHGQDWLDAPQSQRVMQILNNDKGEGGVDAQATAMFVGGCVRNAVMGLPVSDLDIATIHTPDQVMHLLERAGVKTIPTGIDHGTVTAVMDGRHFEITTLRRDIETDGRHAVVRFTDDWAQDAARRDFTMNTLLCDMSGNVYDPLRRGYGDALCGCVHFVGSPEKRIAEDVLRILRFFRFYAYYGSGAPDNGALTACAQAAERIHSLSKERISQEFFKILQAPRAGFALGMMFEHGIMNDIADTGFQCVFFDFEDTAFLNVLAARLLMLNGVGTDFSSLENYLILPSKLKSQMNGIIAFINMGRDMDAVSVKRGVYCHGRDAASGGLYIACARGEITRDVYASLSKLVREWDIPEFPLSGQDLIKEGFLRGPALGEELKRREELWLEDILSSSL